MLPSARTAKHRDQPRVESVKVLKLKDKKQLLYSSHENKGGLLQTSLLNRAGSDIGMKVILLKGMEHQKR